MESIVELAERLGKAIAAAPQAVKLRALRKEVTADKGLTALLQQYHEQADKVAELEEQNKPVEVEDKHRLQELHDKLVASDLFKRFTVAQVDYVDMMRQVNQAIGRQVTDVE